MTESQVTQRERDIARLHEAENDPENRRLEALTPEQLAAVLDRKQQRAEPASTTSSPLGDLTFSGKSGIEHIAGVELTDRHGYELGASTVAPIVAGYAPLADLLAAFQAADQRAMALYAEASSLENAARTAIMRDKALAESAVANGDEPPDATAPALYAAAQRAARKVNAACSLAGKARFAYSTACFADADLVELALDRLESEMTLYERKQSEADAYAPGISAAGLFVRQLRPRRAQPIHEQATAYGTNAAGAAHHEYVTRPARLLRDQIADYRSELAARFPTVGVVVSGSTGRLAEFTRIKYGDQPVEAYPTGPREAVRLYAGKVHADLRLGQAFGGQTGAGFDPGPWRGPANALRDGIANPMSYLLRERPALAAGHSDGASRPEAPSERPGKR